MTNIITVAARGPQGLKGEQGIPGTDGSGVPPGGLTTQALVKLSNTDNDTAWAYVSTGIINSANYVNVGTAFVAAYNSGNPLPLFINNATVTANFAINGISTLPGSVLHSNISSDTPGLSVVGSNTYINGLTLTALNNGTALQISSPNANDVSFVNGYIKCTHYGYLQNDAVYDGRIVANNFVIASYDAINSNNPTSPGNNFVAMGNICDTGGFGVAIARVNSYSIIGNIIRTSINPSGTVAAIHIEDLNTGGIVLGNHAMNCHGEGFSTQVPVIGKGTPGPMVTGFNQYRYTGTAHDTNGIICINDGNGGVTQMGCIGSVVDGFAGGISVSDRQDMFVEGTIVNNCGQVIFIPKHGRSFGTISTQNSPILFIGQAGSMSGGFSSSTTPTTVISKSGGNFPGPAITQDPQLRLPIPVAHTGGGTQQWFNICPAVAGLSFNGVFKANVEGGNGYYYENYYIGTGSATTGVMNKIYGVNQANSATYAMGMDVPGTGAVSGADFRINGGVLQFGFTSSATVTQTGYFEFVGTWQKNI